MDKGVLKIEVKYKWMRGFSFAQLLQTYIPRDILELNTKWVEILQR